MKSISLECGSQCIGLQTAAIKSSSARSSRTLCPSEIILYFLFFMSVCSGAMYLLDVSKGSSKKWQVLSASKHASAHTRIVFNARCTGDDLNTLCTVSMDRQIILWDMTSLKAKFNITTVGGFVYSIQQSAVNPGIETLRKFERTES